MASLDYRLDNEIHTMNTLAVSSLRDLSILFLTSNLSREATLFTTGRDGPSDRRKPSCQFNMVYD